MAVIEKRMIFGSGSANLIKEMIIAFIGRLKMAKKIEEFFTLKMQTNLKNDTRLLEQIGSHSRAGNVETLSEENLDEFAESRRVVVADSFGIANCLHDRIRGENRRFDAVASAFIACNACKISAKQQRCKNCSHKQFKNVHLPHYEFCGNRFACARLAADNERLIFAIFSQIVERLFGNRVDMRHEPSHLFALSLIDLKKSK